MQKWKPVERNWLTKAKAMFSHLHIKLIYAKTKKIKSKGEK